MILNINSVTNQMILTAEDSSDIKQMRDIAKELVTKEVSVGALRPYEAVELMNETWLTFSQFTIGEDEDIATYDVGDIVVPVSNDQETNGTLPSGEVVGFDSTGNPIVELFIGSQSVIISSLPYDAWSLAQ